MTEKWDICSNSQIKMVFRIKDIKNAQIGQYQLSADDDWAMYLKLNQKIRSKLTDTLI